ncbi:hypothetical protein SJI00_21365 [Pseudomonas sp. RP23018S]|uniref:hypothetical protein n=1 Tax=Pseudomonas sp. RP23018S TaxID=3096037 RepID=UPI002AC9FBE0|nr:hypothetical protein [Pseudomonas sp. RP23018S]MDZ5605328.1 hypothetical protein [Pseudomonas sp. RP23018S]
MRSPTLKECPGCKTRQKFYAGDVCHTCSTRLRDFPSMKATLDQMAGGASRRVHFGSRLPLPFGCYSAPSRERMAEALSELLQASFATEVVTDAAVAAIQFALEDDDGMQFLRLWNQGDFDVIRSEWPEAPEQVFIGADPLHKPSK